MGEKYHSQSNKGELSNVLMDQYHEFTTTKLQGIQDQLPTANMASTFKWNGIGRIPVKYDNGNYKSKIAEAVMIMQNKGWHPATIGAVAVKEGVVYFFPRGEESLIQRLNPNTYCETASISSHVYMVLGKASKDVITNPRKRKNGSNTKPMNYGLTPTDQFIITGDNSVRVIGGYEDTTSRTQQEMQRALVENLHPQEVIDEGITVTMDPSFRLEALVSTEMKEDTVRKKDRSLIDALPRHELILQ